MTHGPHGRAERTMRQPGVAPIESGHPMRLRSFPVRSHHTTLGGS